MAWTLLQPTTFASNALWWADTNTAYDPSRHRGEQLAIHPA